MAAAVLTIEQGDSVRWQWSQVPEDVQHMHISQLSAQEPLLSTDAVVPVYFYLGVLISPVALTACVISLLGVPARRMLPPLRRARRVSDGVVLRRTAQFHHVGDCQQQSCHSRRVDDPQRIGHAARDGCC